MELYRNSASIEKADQRGIKVSGCRCQRPIRSRYHLIADRTFTCRPDNDDTTRRRLISQLFCVLILPDERFPAPQRPTMFQLHRKRFSIRRNASKRWQAARSAKDLNVKDRDRR
ncbi:hypothetical protein L596_004509 [Steinernema carpocapsae]|uniref:Uncharacterized protein n=1 Tax=Steinernema carpocapsae TaxID=34508 RepID=A0A4V6I8C1_STECR|nr:hypothetical protein L596_004509 [Steinernema carpocapsae]